MLYIITLKIIYWTSIGGYVVAPIKPDTVIELNKI